MSTVNRDNFEGVQPTGFKAGLAALRKEGSVPDSLDAVLASTGTTPNPSKTGNPIGPGESDSPLQKMMDDMAAREAEEKSSAQGGEDDGQGTDEQQLEAGSDDPEAGEGEEGVEALPEKETIKANGKDLIIDWNDRDTIKQALSRSVMAREYKRDKDTALNHLNEEKKAHEESKSTISSQADTLTQIEKAKALGPEAVIKLLFNRDYSELMDEWEERSGWSDEKKEAYRESQRTKQLEAEIAAMKQAVEDDKEAARLERENAQAERVQTHFDSSYLKFNFDEKLGDAELEDDLNSRLFEKVAKQFNGKEAADVNFTEIEDAFKSERARLLRLYSKGAKKQSEEMIEQHKDKAISTAQRSLQSRTKVPSAQRQAKKAISSPGGWRKLLGNRDLLNQID